ncbi:folylpolyglutamate synthase/dihydrofolate synthase family protein [Ferruginibacter paludis]|uniref:bifunctional folylpolyglutamate synthase/dihydrofolate synthase n=1 Tax=Ferruginibacter paludis TaxID=1310417 RepID=UPI0025B4D312|nr:folylpolyglutamate synthase/dihydrofolate synthase family protein [Ferruginibacter paludis]MDN3658772.1 folylpolyglutamate synthase/dihydrofolate synthase family protein [Ferruginibacter paludis]
MNYQQTIDYLFAQLPMYSRIGAAAYKEDLHNSIALCNALDNPQTKFKSVHIAGTNGKGSTSHMMAAMLQQAGYKTGLYTSPHLKDFRERIKINGEMIEEDFVVDFVARTRQISQQIEPSFFELTMAMAFDYFAQQKVDIAIIETGLGGRLDSTNIITPILSIITNIGYDHMNILGDTLEKIGAEKAGIIKPNIPVVIGEWIPETKAIFDNKAAQCNAPIYFAQDKYNVGDITVTAQTLQCTVTDITNDVKENFTLDLNGIYQSKNLCTVLCAEGILTTLGFTIADAAEKYALANTKLITGLHGRWDVIGQNPMLVLDVAHNQDGIKQVLEQIKWIGKNDTSVKRTIHFIMGMVKDKEVSKVLSLLPSNARYYFTNAHIPRALPAAELQAKASTAGLTGNCFDDVNDAIHSAKNAAGKDDVIIVCGSVFLVGEVK